MCTNWSRPPNFMYDPQEYPHAGFTIRLVWWAIGVPYVAEVASVTKQIIPLTGICCSAAICTAIGAIMAITAALATKRLSRAVTKWMPNIIPTFPAWLEMDTIPDAAQEARPVLLIAYPSGRAPAITNRIRMSMEEYKSSKVRDLLTSRKNTRTASKLLRDNSGTSSAEDRMYKIIAMAIPPKANAILNLSPLVPSRGGDEWAMGRTSEKSRSHTGQPYALFGASISSTSPGNNFTPS
mmetsp:Transcript_36665/g.82533  ORF Transcript_36665/g.82533 Transcript_36665/m.82533 type:complete len:238 (-) Transcript_36665:1907-2620(-)